MWVNFICLDSDRLADRLSDGLEDASGQGSRNSLLLAIFWPSPPSSCQSLILCQDRGRDPGRLFPIVTSSWRHVHLQVTFSRRHAKIQDMLCGLTTDKRVLVLLIAWGFGLLGSHCRLWERWPSASILMTFGIDPIEASVICLAANTTPTAFRAVGLPVITLAQTAG